MLNASLLGFSAAGGILNIAGPPLNFNGGTPMAANGRLAAVAQISGFNVDAVLGGLPYNVNGAIVTDAVNPVTGHAGGIPTTSLGLAIEVDAVPTFYVAGIPISANGRVCFAPPDGPAPPTPRSFSEAFSGAYG